MPKEYIIYPQFLFGKQIIIISKSVVDIYKTIDEICNTLISFNVNIFEFRDMHTQLTNRSTYDILEICNIFDNNKNKKLIFIIPEIISVKGRLKLLSINKNNHENCILLRPKNVGDVIFPMYTYLLCEPDKFLIDRCKWIKFQSYYGNYKLRKELSLKLICRNYILSNNIKYDIGDIPKEIINYLRINIQ